MQAQATAFKLCVCGAAFSGKSSLLERYIRNSSLRPESTIGAVYATHIIQPFGDECIAQEKLTITDETQRVFDSHKDKLVKLMVWDTAGQEKYRALGPLYFRSCACGIIVFDLTSRDSFQQVSVWANEVLKANRGSVQLVVIGNKCDLNSARQVSQEEAKEAAAKIDAMYFETSALTGENVHHTFNDIARTLFLQKVEQDGGDGTATSDAGGGTHDSVDLASARSSSEIGWCCAQ
eukprot:m.126773 g.126773  ORF g.126773 m.126773 type:complete len:235 (-) comp13843_c0_seq4:384-1088(-)